MSHFTVLVIGENPEKLLAPYHEYECTGIKDEHVVFVAAEEDLEAEYKKNKGYKSIDDFIEDYYGYEKIDGVYGRYTNPNAQWDWYELGGRWTGYFKVKESTGSYKVGRPGLMTDKALKGFADQLLKRDIDFDHKDYTPYALVVNGKWLEKGEMGWWGISSNEKSDEEWSVLVKAKINEAADDSLFSLYDCHI